MPTVTSAVARVQILVMRLSFVLVMAGVSESRSHTPPVKRAYSLSLSLSMNQNEMSPEVSKE